MRITRQIKKAVLLFAVVALPLCALAQKTYVNIVAMGVNNNYGHNIYISGDIPSDIQSFYDDYYDKTKVGEVINQLASHGFEVEQMSCAVDTDGSMKEIVLLSKNASPTPTQIRREAKGQPDSEAVEVARYNLQGMPVQPNEKGLQVVVYSNYTTRTVIVE